MTEKITDLDLVELQLKIAAGHRIQFSQEEIANNGYAIEARAYAEDFETYFPSPGKINRMRLPEGQARFDFAYEEGNTVSPFYDPMVGKIIIHGQNRSDALDKFDKLLEEIEIEGITTNMPLFKSLLEDKNFREGIYTTKYLQSRNGGKETIK